MSALKYLDPFPLVTVAAVVILTAVGATVVLPLGETVVRVGLAVLLVLLLVAAGLWMRDALQPE